MKFEGKLKRTSLFGESQAYSIYTNTCWGRSTSVHTVSRCVVLLPLLLLSTWSLQERHIYKHTLSHVVPLLLGAGIPLRRRRWSLREKQVGVDWQGEEEGEGEEGERQGSWPEISSDRGVCLAEEPCEGGRRRGRTTSQTDPTDTCTCTCQRAAALLQPRFASSVCLLSSHLSL